MTSEFDWSQFEEEPGGEKKSFDWSQFEEDKAVPENKSIHFPKLGMGKKVANKSQVGEMKRTLGRTGKVVASTALGLPGDVVSGIGEGLNWIAKQVPGGKPKEEEELKHITENPLTSKSIQSGIEKLAPSTAPLNESEKEWEDNLSLLTSLVLPVPGGQSKFVRKGNKKLIYETGKRIGLSEKEIAPLLHGNVTEKLLGKLAKKSKEAHTALKNTEAALGNVYDVITDKASKLPQLHAHDTIKLIDKFEDISMGLKKTLGSSPETKSVVKFIDEAIEKANNFGTSPEELINFYREINKMVNWNSVKGGKKTLEALKKPIFKTLSSIYPKLAKDLTDTNALYSKMKGVQKALGVNKIQEYIDAGATTAFLGSIFTGNLDLAEKIAVGYAGKKALGKISAKLLTDPKWQNLHSKISVAIKNKSIKGSSAILQILKNKVKEDLPEEYKEINWPD